MKTINLLGAKCILNFGTYPNNTIGISAYRQSDGDYWCVPTVNWEDNYPDINYAEKYKFPMIVIKNCNENKGVYEQLLAAGVIETGVSLPGSNDNVLAAKLTTKWKEIARKQLDQQTDT